jgi:hypothetical protein
VNFSQALEYMRIGYRARRVGRVYWVYLLRVVVYPEQPPDSGLRFQQEGAPGDMPLTITQFDTTEVLAEDWEVDPIGGMTTLRSSTPTDSFIISAAGGVEVLRLNNHGEIYVRGRLVERDEEVASRLLEVLGAGLRHEPASSSPGRSRLERVLDDD